MKTVLILIFFFSLAFGQGKKEEPKDNALFKITIDKDRNVKVYDINKSQNKTTDSIIKNKSTNEKGTSKNISGEKDGTALQLQNETKQKSGKSIEKGSSKNITNSKDGANLKYIQIKPPKGSLEKGESLDINSSKQNSEVKYKKQEWNQKPIDQEDKGPVKDKLNSPLTLPNLTVYTGTGSANNYTYTSSTHFLNINNSVVNNGGTNAGPFEIGWYLSTNTTISTSDYLIATTSTSGLASGYYINAWANINLDNISALPYGTYYVGVYFDDLNQVAESNESDNSGYLTPTINYYSNGAPNLYVYTGTGSINNYSYSSTTHDLTINSSFANNGTANAGPFEVGWYLSTNDVISTGDYLLATLSVGGLATGYYNNGWATLNLDNISALPSGTYYVGVYLDDLYQINESDETDNSGYYTPTIDYYSNGYINLSLFSGTGSINSISYDRKSYTLNAGSSCGNFGTVDAGAFRVGYYLSVDSHIDATDNLIGTSQVSNLPAGYFINTNITKNLNNISWGTYYLGFVFDDLDQIYESDETDNAYYYSTYPLVVSVDDEIVKPVGFDLAQNYPNPFNPSTTIKFCLPERVNVTLTIFDQLGAKVAVLLNEMKEAGYHTVNWNASDLVSGVYFYELKSGNNRLTKKLLLMK